MKIQHLCYVAAVVINVFTPPYSEKAMAQEACGTVGLPPIGYTCYEDLVVNVRTDYGHTQKFSGESTAGKGYVISRVEFINKAQFGSVSGPNIKKVESNTAYEIGSILNEESKHLEEVAKHAEVQGNNINYVADFLDRFKKEVSARREALMKAQSNVDVVSFEGSVSGRCVTRALGACVDSTGGKLEGYVRVHKVYIGTPESTRQFVEAAKQQILSLAEKPETNLSQKLPPGTDLGHGDLPRAFVDVNGDGRTDYCRFVGDLPNLFVACALGSADGFGEQYAYQSIKGIDKGYDNRPRGFRDANSDGRADYCRFVGDPPNIYESCNLATPSGFDPNQYTLKLP